MSMDSQTFVGSNFFSLQGNILSENLFSSPQSDFMKENLMQDVMLNEDSQSADLVVAREVSGVDDLDHGYDTNSDLSSPMSAKSDWEDSSTPSSTGSIDETSSLFSSCLDDDTCYTQWEQSFDCKGPSPAISQPILELSPRSPMVGLSSSAAPNDFTVALHKLLQPSQQEVETPSETSKPIRKRSAASLSTCGLTPRKRARKYPSLIQALPDKLNGAEIQITVQPEKHHRARYRTEGSRGSVKDDSGENFPKLKLLGVNQQVLLQVFVVTDQGKVRPHGYYQACKVTGRNTTPSEEKDVEGTTVLEVPWEPVDGKMEISVDCIGILKLRNADVEQRIGPIRSKRKSTCVRLAFRVIVPSTSDDSFNVLQIASRSITCTQPLGHPEILKKSLTECSVAGGEDLFIIGKNFTSKANTEVKLRQLDDNGKVTWEGDCEIDKALFQNNHIVCKIPSYPNLNLRTPVTVYLVVTGKPNQCSDLDAHPIVYRPKIDEADMHTATVAYGDNKQVGLAVTSPIVLPPTPTSPVETLIPDLSSVSPDPVKIEKPAALHQAPPTPSPQPNEEEFALTLQMLATAYLQNKDMYNSLLMQTTQPEDLVFQRELEEMINEQPQAWQDIAVVNNMVQVPVAVQADVPVEVKAEVPIEVWAEVPAVVEPETGESHSPMNTEPDHSIVASELAAIFPKLGLPGVTDPLVVLDDVLDILNNN